MAFLDEVTLPTTKTGGGIKSTTGGGSFFDNVQAPNTQSLKEYSSMKDIAVAKQEASKNPLRRIFDETVKGVKDIIKAPFTKQSFNPLKTGEAILDTESEIAKDTGQRFRDAFLTEHKTKMEAGVDYAKAALGALNFALSPITATLKGMETVPGFGYGAAAINRAFESVGQVGINTFDETLNNTEIFSPETREKLRPVVQELGALTAQVVGGKLGVEGYNKVLPKIAENAKIITDTTKKEIETRTAVVDKKIATDIKPKGDFFDNVEAPVKPVVTQETPAPVVPEPTVSATGELKPSALTENTAVGALEKGIIETVGDLPEYRTMNMADQAQKALDLVQKDPDLAKKIALGESPTVGDIRPVSIYKALEAKARDSGDVALTLDLAGSELGKTLSAYGQEIKAADVQVPNSPVEAIKQINEARASRYKNAVKSGAVERDKIKISSQIKNNIKASLPKKETWNDFINELTC